MTFQQKNILRKSSLFVHAVHAPSDAWNVHPPYQPISDRQEMVKGKRRRKIQGGERKKERKNCKYEMYRKENNQNVDSE